jgi:NAD(P)-dependent dehydrogenase (short-subunit alcohol dehydrogenase family)
MTKPELSNIRLLEGNVAFVTGGASGIGAGIAERFAQAGAKVAIADLEREAGEKYAAELEARGFEVLFVQCDVSDSNSVRDAIGKTVAQFGKLEILVANAGINGTWAPVDELLPEEWDHTLGINLRGTYLTAHHGVPFLKRAGSGSIIIIASVNGTRTFSSAGASAYSSSKAGQVAFAKMLALELGRDHIRCNAICPGLIHTRIEESTEKRDTEKLGMQVELPAGSPALNEGEADPLEVADVALFLASDLSRHVSGVELFVDGGASLLR